MTLKEFINTYKGVKNVGNTTDNKGECVGLVMVWIQNLGLTHIWGHARDIFNNASPKEYLKIENSPNIYPIAGDIICWNSSKGGGYGHVAIVIESNKDKDTVKVFEQNCPLGSPPKETVYNDWDGIIGWLHPFVLDEHGVEEEIHNLEESIEKLIKNVSDIENKMVKEIENLKEEMKLSKKEIKSIKEKLENCITENSIVSFISDIIKKLFKKK